MIDKLVPGKRLKTWHRHYRGALGTASLRQFARGIVATPESDERSRMERRTAIAWADGKVAPKERP